MADGKPRGRKQGAGKFEDPYPRQKPPEQEEPPNWKMAVIAIDQALVALKGDKDSQVRDNAAEHLRDALKYLYPQPDQI